MNGLFRKKSLLCNSAHCLHVNNANLPSENVKFILAVIVLLVDLLAFSTKYYTYFLIPAFKMKNRTIVLNPRDTYRVAPSNDCIVIQENGSFSVSAFVKIPVYKSASEMTQDERIDFSKAFTRILTISRDPFKLATQMYVVNKDDYIQEIRNKLDEAEARYADLNAKLGPTGTSPDLERAKGELTMWRNLFDNVSKVRSNALATFAMVTANAPTEEEATAIALQKAEELAAGVSAALGVSAYVMNANEFLQLIEPEQIIPFSTISAQMEEKTASLGV